MALPQTLPSPKTVTPAVAVTQRDDQHRYRRRFVGPMPESVVSEKIHNGHDRNKGWFRVFNRASSTEDEEDANLQKAIGEHAFSFFLSKGGRKDDWDALEETNIREEMLRKWRESEWGKARRDRRDAKLAKRWIGNSFDVGVFLGVDVLDGRGATTPGTQNEEETSTARPQTAAQSSSAEDTFATARSNFTPAGATSGIDLPSALEPSRSQGEWSVTREDDANGPIDAHDSTSALLPKPTASTADGSPSRAESNGILRPVDQRLAKKKGKAKMVHYPEPEEIEAAPEEPQAPAPPDEVLARTGTAVQESSAGAAAHATAKDQASWGDVIIRDRMVVRVSSTEAETVGTTFDEAKNRVTPHIENIEWSEYIVAWRKDRLELYRDHRTIGKEWYTGRKHLAFVVPLNPTTTRLSLYSFLDFSFCLTCPQASLRTRAGRRVLSAANYGLNIFVFKVKTRSRAVDWFWQIWRYLGGELPPFIEIRVPALDTRLKVDIPADFAAAYDVFTRPNIVNLCMQKLRMVQDYDILIEQRLAEGFSLELAWRMETNLDWVWQTEDVEGKYREWTVLCGIALKQAGKHPHLELRLKTHFPTRLHLKDGTRMDEPVPIEGYLDRINPNSPIRHPIYLATHDGYLFALPSARAHPPAPPGPLLEAGDADALRRAEVQRGSQQILEATGVSDLRSIVVVRRAFQLIPRQSEPLPSREAPIWEDTEDFWTDVERFDSDEEDEGGEAGLLKVRDKARMRMRRSFELLLTTGRVVRFEAHSCQVALEWIMRLRQLVSYWRKRHEVDAANEMHLVHASTGRLRLTPPKHACNHDGAHAPESPPDLDASLPELGSFFHWCVMETCRPILKCGRLFARKGLRGQYKQIQLILTAGHLVQYHITGKTSLHHRRHKSINLPDGYVCSGYFAAQYLPEGEYDPDAPPLARRYQDGLESDDCEEDTLFIIWYYARPASNQSSGAGYTASTGQDGQSSDTVDVPPLSAKRKLAVFRTRSKIERDAWVWAINCEIEKIVRAGREREAKIREAGVLMQT